MKNREYNIKKKNIFIFGGYGGVNLGDECILFSLIKLIEDNCKEVNTVSVISRYNNQINISNCNLKINYYKKKSLLKLIFNITKGNLLIGGGQLLNCSKYPKGLLYIAFITILFKILGNKVYIVGVGCSRMNSRLCRILLNCITRFSDWIYVRDKSSIEEISKNTNHNRIKLIPDLVFSQKILELVDKSNLNIDRSRTIIVVLHSTPGETKNNYKFYNNLLVYLLRYAPNEKIVCLAHDLREEYDLGLLNLLSNNTNLSSHITFTNCKNEKQLVNLYTNATMVISSRMHPLIVGSICGCKIIGIRGSDKVKDLAEDMGFPVINNHLEKELLGFEIKSKLEKIFANETHYKYESYLSEKKLGVDNTLSELAEHIRESN
jgi:polysaccharide pyruvyl transferase WcaK-like protein